MASNRHSITGSVVPDFSRNENEITKNDGSKKKPEEMTKPTENKKKEEEERKKKEEERKRADITVSGAESGAGEEDESGDEVVLTNSEGKSSYEIIMYARKVKRIFVVSLTFKICMLIICACVLGFAAESTPNIDVFDCKYDHRPGFVAFFMVVHAFFFCIMIFLMAYQLFYQLKEKARIPQRVMDLMWLVILIIVCSISLACYALWFDDTLGVYYQECQQRPMPRNGCINRQTCDMFASMRTMAIGAMFWGGLLVFFLIIGAILLGCVIGKKMMDSPEGQALYKKIQEESDLSVRGGGGGGGGGGNVNHNSNVTPMSQMQYEDEELGYGGEGLALFNFDKQNLARQK